MTYQNKTKKELIEEIRRLKKRLDEFESNPSASGPFKNPKVTQESQVQAVVEGSLAGILIVNDNFQIVKLNPQAGKILGFSRSEMINHDFREFIAPEHRDMVASRYLRRMAGEKMPSHYEFNVITKEGRQKQVEINAIVIKDANQKPLIVAHILDVTEKNQTKARLKEEELKYRETVNHIPLALINLNKQGVIISVNPSFERILKIPASSVVHKTKITDLSIFANTPLLQSFKNLIEHQKRFDRESPPLIRPGGEQIYLRCRGIPLPQTVSGSLQYVVLLGDITERKQSEQALRRRVDLERIITTLSAEFVRLSPNEVDEGINRALKILGEFSRVDRGYLFLFRDDGKRVENTHEWCAEGVEPRINNLQSLSADLFPWWMKKLRKFETIHIPRVADLPLEASPEKELLQAQEIQSLIILPLVVRNSLIGFLGFDSVKKEKVWSDETIELLKIISGLFASVLDRKWAEEALRESEERFRTLFNHATDYILIIDPNHKDVPIVVDANESAFKMHGYSREELIGKPISFLDAPEQHKFIKERVRKIMKGESVTFETVHVRKDGSRFPVEVSARLIEIGGKSYIFAIERDISERKKTDEALRESEERYRNLVENSPVPIVIHIGGKVVFVNPPAVKVLGAKSEKDLLGQKVIDWVHPDYRELVLQRVRSVYKEKKKAELTEEKFIRQDGKVIDVEVVGTAINYQGKPASQVVFLDITDRKRMEEALRESEQRYRLLFDMLPYGGEVLDTRGFITNCSPSTAQMLGYETKELIGKHITQFLHPDSVKVFKKKFQNLVKGRREDAEVCMIRKDGSKLAVLRAAQPIFSEQGQLTGILALSVDISERKQAETVRQIMYNIANAVNTTRSTADLYQVIERELHKILNIKNLYIGLYERDSDTISFPFMQDEKDRFEKVPAGKTLSSLVIKEGRSILVTEKQIKQLAAKGKIKIVGTLSKCWMGVPLRVDGEVIGIIAVQDYQNESAFGKPDLELLEFVSNQVAISIKKKQTDEEIRKLSLAIEQSPSSVIITDLEGKIVYVNQKFSEVTGYSRKEILGQKPSILKSGETPEEEYRELWRTITAGKEWRGEFCNRRKDGGLFWELASISPIKNSEGKITHYLGIKEDITERRKLQQQLLQSQKMEAIGKLAGGVAHDFNNLLTVINGYADLLLYKLSSDDPPYKAIRQIKLAGERAASLTEQLLAFSRRQLIQPKILNLNEVIMDTEKMLRRLIGEDVDLLTKTEPNLGNIKADPTQIEQVIMNLAVNARDAMPRGGKLTIETANVLLDEIYVKEHEQVQPGAYVMLAISDNGKGMDEETRSRIFEPFFTTKGPGEGTGLGLSTVYGIIKQNRGYVWVYSEPEKGTTFKIYLPRVPDESIEQNRVSDAHKTIRGNETILLVEDDESVRELSSRILKENGYNVLEADRGSSAIEISQQYDGTIHLLLTDVVMPEMSGRELSERLGKLRPEIKIIYVSGYTDNAIAHHGVLDKKTHFIQKPFAPQTLLEKIREVLEQE